MALSTETLTMVSRLYEKVGWGARSHIMTATLVVHLCHPYTAEVIAKSQFSDELTGLVTTQESNKKAPLLAHFLHATNNMHYDCISTATTVSKLIIYWSISLILTVLQTADQSSYFIRYILILNYYDLGIVTSIDHTRASWKQPSTLIKWSQRKIAIYHHSVMETTSEVCIC